MPAPAFAAALPVSALSALVLSASAQAAPTPTPAQSGPSRDPAPAPALPIPALAAPTLFLLHPLGTYLLLVLRLYLLPVCTSDRITYFPSLTRLDLYGRYISV